MSDEKLCKRIRALYNRISRDLDKSISPKKCNEHVEDLELLKEELYNLDYDWIDNYERVYEVGEPGFFSEGANDAEIHETLEIVISQLDRMLCYMGADISESREVKQQLSGNIPPININVSPKMTQNVETSADAQVSVEIKQEVERLAREFEKEYQRMFPDKSRLKEIIEILKTLGPYAAPFITKFTDLLGKLW